MEIFTAQNITKRFTNHLALNDVSISVQKQSIFGLLGPNGAGKTTLIRIINQIIAPDTGQLFIEGEKLQPKDIEQIGYLPEERGLYKKMKVGEQSLYLARLKGMTKHDALTKLKYWFEKFEIQDWWNKKVEELSKGMQQKIQFIITVLHEPKLLIFDEPFTGFDPINTNLIKNEIIKLREKGATIIFSTHNMESVEELCDHIVLIDNAKKILDGSVTEIRKTYKSNMYEITFTGNMTKLTNALNGYGSPTPPTRAEAAMAGEGPALPEGEGAPTLKKPSQIKYELIEQTQDGELCKAKVKIPDKSNPNELLERILPNVQIQSFNEVLPSMRDVFIQVVKGER